MQWSCDLAAEMHRRCLVWNQACRTTSPSLSHDCSCDSEWQCELHNACFIHNSCFCPSSSAFPQLSLPIRRYPPIIPSLCALGQQVIAYRPVLLFYHTLCSYCLVIASSYTIVLDFLIVLQSLLFRLLIMLIYAYSGSIL